MTQPAHPFSISADHHNHYILHAEWSISGISRPGLAVFVDDHIAARSVPKPEPSSDGPRAERSPDLLAESEDLVSIVAGQDGTTYGDRVCKQLRIKRPSDCRKNPVGQTDAYEPNLNQRDQVYEPEAKVLFPNRTFGGFKDKKPRHYKSESQCDRKGQRHRILKPYKKGNQDATGNIYGRRRNADEEKAREAIIHQLTGRPRKLKAVSVHFRATTKNCFPSTFHASGIRKYVRIIQSAVGRALFIVYGRNRSITVSGS